MDELPCSATESAAFGLDRDRVDAVGASVLGRGLAVMSRSIVVRSTWVPLCSGLVYEIAKNAGWAGAHGIWSVSDADLLVPLIGYVNADGSTGLERFVADDAADAARSGAERLRQGRPEWACAALVVDSYLRLPTGRVDALVIDAVEYLPQRRSVQFAVPFRPHTSAEGFAVFRLKFLAADGFDQRDFDGLADSFFSGVDSHEQAAAVWNAHLVDESV